MIIYNYIRIEVTTNSDKQQRTAALSNEHYQTSQETLRVEHSVVTVNQSHISGKPCDVLHGFGLLRGAIS